MVEPFQYEVLAKIDKILEFGFTETNKEALLSIIKENKVYQNYFLSKVKSIKWFKILEEEGYFSAEKAPTPKPAEQENYFTVPQWNVLSYLEHASQQMSISGNMEYIKNLLTIIKNVTNFAETKTKLIDNYLTWLYFTKILTNIPNERVTLEIINLLPLWLKTKYGMNILGHKVATELLQKFLPDIPVPGDIEKAQRIVDSVTEVKWMSSKDYFSFKEEARTLVDSHSLFESFIKNSNAAKVGNRCTTAFILTIAEKIKNIFRRRNNPYALDFDRGGKIYRMWVKHSKDFEFEGVVGLFDKENIEDRSGKEIIYRTPIHKPKPMHQFMIQDCKTKETFVARIQTELSKVELNDVLNSEFNERVHSFYQGIYSDFSYIWFESIAIGPRWTAVAAQQVLTIIWRDILLAKVKKEPKITDEVFIELLSEKYQYPFFKRLVLFIISECWDDLKDEFWALLNKPGGRTLFDNPNFEVEIYTLLERNINKFTHTEKENLKAIIENGPTKFLPEQNQERYKNYWKQKWYSAIRENTFFTPLYEEHKRMTNIEEKISFREPKTKTGPGPSPLSQEELVKMSNTELAQFSMTFKTKDFWEGPTVNGLAEALKNLAQEKPEVFVDDLLPFLNVGYYYVYQILHGIREAWNKKKDFNWQNLLDFIRQYIDRPEFWQNRFKIADDHWNADYQWVIWVIADLIQDGTKTDERAYSEDLLPATQDIIFVILNNLHAEKEIEVLDPITHAMNSSYGSILTALIYLALRIARLQDIDGEDVVRWHAAFREMYEKMLDGAIIQAYTLFGQYMRNLYYLDKSWVESKICDFASLEDDRLWSAFMYGYLATSRFQEDLYTLMKRHYQKASKHEFKEDHINKMLIQHLCIGYLRCIEGLSSSSLFGNILAEWDVARMIEIVNFFWTQRDVFRKSPIGESSEQCEKRKDRIIQFWQWLYEKLKDKESSSEEDKKILSATAKLAGLLAVIDDKNFKWLQLSATYVYIGFTDTYFIECLNRLKDKGDKIKSAKYVGQLFLIMLNKLTPVYKQEHIRSIVEYLYDVGDKETGEMANKICNIYGSREFQFLRDLWDKYNILVTKK